MIDYSDYYYILQQIISCTAPFSFYFLCGVLSRLPSCWLSSFFRASFRFHCAVFNPSLDILKLPVPCRRVPRVQAFRRWEACSSPALISLRVRPSSDTRIDSVRYFRRSYLPYSNVVMANAMELSILEGVLNKGLWKRRTMSQDGRVLSLKPGKSSPHLSHVSCLETSTMNNPSNNFPLLCSGCQC